LNYLEVLAYLDRLGNEVQTMKFGLETTRAILRRLGNPQEGFPSILVAGTNGKGSVASFLHQVLSSSGRVSGVFTSPHLERIEERIRIGDESVSEAEFSGSFSTVLEAVRALDLELHPTFFELITCTALNCFAMRKVDVAVLEVGMGGRLDSTNTVEPVLSVITSIGYDHQQYLGDTLARIAGEKAGILRPGVPAISAPQPGEVSEVLLDKAAVAGTELAFLTGNDYALEGSSLGCYRFIYGGAEYRLGVPGGHQAENAALALMGLEILKERGWNLDAGALRTGIAAMRRPGVLEILRGVPDIILDGGHNPGAARKLRRFLEEHVEGPLTLLFGMMKDKDIAAVAGILEPVFQRKYLVPIDSSRACPVELLRERVPEGIPAPSLEWALEEALRHGNTVVAAGSFFLAGAVRRILRSGRYGQRLN